MSDEFEKLWSELPLEYRGHFSRKVAELFWNRCAEVVYDHLEHDEWDGRWLNSVIVSDKD